MKKILFLFAIASLLSCEPIDFRTDITQIIPEDNQELPKVCIDGTVSSENDYCMVRVYKPQKFSDDNLTPMSTSWDNYNNLTGITGATVTLEIQNKVYSFIEAKNHPYTPEDYNQIGYYMSEEKIEGIPGEIHTLRVLYKNVEYVATDIMPESVEIHSLAEMFPIEQFNGMSFNRVVFGKEEGYIADYDYILKEYGYNSGTVDSANFTINHVIRQNYFFSHYISPALMEEAKWTNANNTFSFYSDYNLMVKKKAISEKYQSYLIDFYSETYWQNSDFRTMPATPVSNISNGGMGYFYATNVDSILVTKEEVEKVIVREE